ncbi:MAG: hypothetical protein KIS66_02650 [Fimbriimonadaceae bacterium]|nr:hypothetical protein [Fimbriimonadaceae bacterium]
MTMYVSVVGSRDPLGSVPGEFGPCVTVAAHLQTLAHPVTRVVLVANREPIRGAEVAPGVPRTHEHNARETADLLEAFLPEADRRVEIVDFNPALAEDVYRVLRATLSDAPNEAIVHFNVSSGTPGSAAAITAIALSGRFANVRLWQVLDPRFRAGHVVECTLTAETLAVRVREAQQCLRSMDFHGAARVLRTAKALSGDAARSERLDWLAGTAEALGHWDIGDYRLAKEKIDAIVRTPPPASCRPVHELATSWAKWLAELVRPDLLAVALDLYASLSRRLATKNYPNVSTRARSALQKTMRYVLSLCLKQPVGPKTTLNDRRTQASGERLAAVWRQTPGILVKKRTCHNLAFPASTWNAPRTRDLCLPVLAYLNESHQRTIELHGTRGSDESLANLAIEKVRNALSVVAGHDLPPPHELALGADAVIEFAESLPSYVA